jgi:hypothetical protein
MIMNKIDIKYQNIRWTESNNMVPVIIVIREILKTFSKRREANAIKISFALSISFILLVENIKINKR